MQNPCIDIEFIVGMPSEEQCRAFWLPVFREPGTLESNVYVSDGFAFRSWLRAVQSLIPVLSYAVSGGRVVGIAQFYITTSGHWEVHVNVRNGFRRSGLALAMIQNGIDHLKEHEDMGRGVIAHVRTSNDGGMKVFAKAGFSACGILPNAWMGPNGLESKTTWWLQAPPLTAR